MPITDQGMSGKPGGDTGNPGVAVPPPPLKQPKGKKGEIKLTPPSKKLKDIVDISPQMEGKESHHVFTFGRMNPPTTGHEKLIHKTHAIAKSKGAKANIVLSHSHDSKKNPVPQDHKIGYVKKIHSGVHVTGSSKEHPTFMHHAKKAHEAGHTHLHMVAGSDRVKEYQNTLNKYNGHPDHYNFKSITVHSAGHRDPDGEGVSGISGTKMRDHARSGDHKSFKAGLPKSLHAHHKEIAGHIKEGFEDAELMEWVDSLTDFELDEAINEDYLVEDLINERVYTLMQRRKAAIKMRRLKYRVQRMRKLKRKRMATADMLKRRARRQARNLMRKRIAGPKGANYSALSPSEKMQIDKRIQSKLPIINKLAKRLMPKVKSAELVRLRAARSKKQESVNHSFQSFIGDLVNEGTTGDNDRSRFSLQNYLNQTSEVSESPTNKVFAKLKKTHDAEDDKLDKRQDIAKEKLKIQLAKSKQAEIRREAADIASAVDMMIEAIEAIESKAIKADIDPDLLMVEYVDGYNNPHGKQTPQQGGFAAINRKIAEMSAAEKDKAEDIVKGMKKKASYFTKKYGEKADSVMYATANKLAQEEKKHLRDLLGDHDKPELDEGKGLWANIHAKRKRGEKMNPKGHPDAPTPAEMKKAQEAYPAGYESDMNKMADKQKNTWWKSQDKAKVAADKKKKEMQKEDYGAMKDAQAHAKKDGHDYDRDVSVQHKYDAYHMKKRGYTHRKYNSYGSYEYNKHGAGNKITSADHHGISESIMAMKTAGKLAGMAAKAYGPTLAKAAAVKAAPYVAAGAAAYGAKKVIQKKLKDKKTQKMINKAADQAVAKYKADQGYEHDHPTNEAVGAAYMPDAGAVGTPEREITSKAVLKQLNRNANRDKMKGKKATPKVRYVQDRDKSTDLVKTDKKSKKRGAESKKDQRKKGDTHDKIHHTKKDKRKEVEEGGNAGWEAFRKRQGKTLRKRLEKHRDDEDNKARQFKRFGDVEDSGKDSDKKGKKEVKEDRTTKMNQLFRMGLAKKGEVELMKRAMKRGEGALKDPKLRGKLFDLLQQLVDLITDKENNAIYVRLRQDIQNKKTELQAAEEAFDVLGAEAVNEMFNINIRFEEIINTYNEDMSGMSVSSGHKRSVKQGAGMTKKGVEAYKRRNPGSKLQTAVTTPPSKLKPGSKAAGRRKAFCSRSKSWSSDRGKAARRRWNC